MHLPPPTSPHHRHVTWFGILHVPYPFNVRDLSRHRRWRWRTLSRRWYSSPAARNPYGHSFLLRESSLNLLGCTVTAEDMVSEFRDDGLVHLPAPSARLAFSPPLDTSVSPTFSNFSPSTSSGYSIPSPDSVHTPSDPDDAWNLIPYNVSWGHEYEEYRAGILPGPEGDCIFLRSPTPLRNQRASEACKKCRERKAKVCPTLPPFP